MAGNNHYVGFQFQGKVDNVQQPTVVQGGNNTININPTLPRNADETETPIPEDISALKDKVTRKIEELKKNGEEFPQKELFRKKLDNFYRNTSDPDGLALQLYQCGVLNETQNEKVKKETLDYDKNNILYDIVLSKGAVLELLPALKKSGNENILTLIDELAS